MSRASKLLKMLEDDSELAAKKMIADLDQVAPGGVADDKKAELQKKFAETIGCMMDKGEAQRLGTMWKKKMEMLGKKSPVGEEGEPDNKVDSPDAEDQEDDSQWSDANETPDEPEVQEDGETDVDAESPDAEDQEDDSQWHDANETPDEPVVKEGEDGMDHEDGQEEEEPEHPSREEASKKYFKRK